MIEYRVKDTNKKQLEILDNPKDAIERMRELCRKNIVIENNCHLLIYPYSILLKDE